MIESRVRLFCFPFSGGSAISYRELGAAIGTIDVTTLELPGRGRRFSEPPLYTVEGMVDDLLEQIGPVLRDPYALFGHSMGAILAYLVAKRLIARGLPQPLALFASGCRAPAAICSEGWHLLPRPAFRAVLADLGGCPPAILVDPELMALYEPVLRADFRAIADYRYASTLPFEFPITVLLGDGDNVSDDEAGQWQRETTHPLVLRKFVGNHFFIFRHWPNIRQLISNAVAKRLAAHLPGVVHDPGETA